MENSIRKRRSLKGRITRIENTVTSQGAGPWDKRSVKGYYEQLDQFWNELQVVHEDIGQLCTDEEFTQQQIEYDQMAARIESLRTKLPDLEEDEDRNEGRNENAVVSSSQTTVRLPRLELPTFSGSLHEWISYHDLFTASIHSNEKLTGAQKLQYLKSSLKGEAAMLIQSIQVTDRNFTEAWDILKKRYHNKREIINAHLRRLCAQQTLTTEAPIQLRKLIDVTNETIRALRVMQVPVDEWDVILVYLVSERLDHDTRRQWELTLSIDDVVKFEDLMTFLDQRARALLTCGVNRSNRGAAGVPDRRAQRPFPVRAAHHSTSSSREACPLCNDRHAVYQCGEFLEASVENRRHLVREHSLCYNCLSGEHQQKKCKSGACRKCGGRHHSLLHSPSANAQRAAVESQQTRADTHEAGPSTAAHHVNLNLEERQLAPVLLATSLIKIQDQQGSQQVCRALMDSGSQATFVSEACVQRLGLPKRRTSVTVKGISASSVNMSRSIVELQISSCLKPGIILTVQALVLTKVTGTLPSAFYDTTQWSHVPSSQLADPSYNVPNPVDVLLGADVFAEVVRGRISRGPTGTPIAQLSAFGWLVSGRVDSKHATVQVSANTAQLELLQVVQRFWELEEMPKIRTFTEEEKACEAHFAATHQRDADGRYKVRLPFKVEPVVIDFRESRNMAIKRFSQVERRLEERPELQREYNDFLEEYARLGHMNLITMKRAAESSSVYFPHHSVIKEDSTTTHLRVVFDASAKSRLGMSLNDHLMVGPVQQEDIFNLLIRFRTHAIALTADISKMYRQIRVHEDDTRYQNIVWRPSSDQPLQDYQLQTLTYGTSSAPFLAVRCLQQLAQDEGEEFPAARAAAQRDFYVDDLLSGAPSEEEARRLQEQLTAMLARGGFPLRKWISSSPAVLNSVPQDQRATTKEYVLDSDDSFKTLGLHWQPAMDQFSFHFKIADSAAINSKRTILSTLARIYDPLGWLSPVTIKAKIILQQLWRTPCTWDDPLPPEVRDDWCKFQGDLNQIEALKIPRRITQNGGIQLELHGFCDSSEQAYAAAVYLKSADASGRSQVELIAAKTRVAPIKKISIPRLELCGALLLARLIETIQGALSTPVENVHAWTDSMVVLAWINSDSHRWKTFVANRVNKIQASVASRHWQHVKSQENPADCASRGIMPGELINQGLWWKGPEWLHHPLNDERPVSVEETTEEAATEERTSHIAKVEVPSLLHRFSSFQTLIRVTVYIFRFVTNCRTSMERRQAGPPTNEELNHAEFYWIKMAQGEEFSEELKCLLKGNPVPKNSRLITLSPFLDANGLIRVGGRLRYADINIERKYPVILPHKHTITTLIIRREHLRLLHAGPQLLLYSLQQKYWITGGRKIVRQHVQACVICWRLKTKPNQPEMGNLPAARVTPSRPFQRCGVDYAGPMTLKVMKLRGQRTFKAYIAVFVCFSTHAVHLELVSDLSTDSFLAAFKRFVARRGHCSDIFSDQGTNFVGASRELRELQQLVSTPKHNNTMAQHLGETKTTWHLNPPSAPHFGGLWEAGVKSVKHHLRRVVGDVSLNFEEMSTVLAQIEACLNSRPLCPMSTNPDDLSALTPGHFLIGGPLVAFPDHDYTETKLSRLSRWQLVQRLSQQFWKRWRQEFLSRLQQKPRSWSQAFDIKVGDLVIIKDDKQSPLHWKLGRIVATFPGKDDIVRVVSVKTALGELRRPVVKVCKLPFESQE